MCTSVPATRGMSLSAFSGCQQNELAVPRCVDTRIIGIPYVLRPTLMEQGCLGVLAIVKYTAALTKPDFWTQAIFKSRPL